MDACMSLTRDACAGRMLVSREMGTSESELLFKHVVFATEFLQGIGLLHRMPYDWGVSNMVSACNNLNIRLIQFVLCSNRTMLTLDWVRVFVIGDAARVQMKCRNKDRNRL